MQVTLKRINRAVHFEGSNAEGNTVSMDGAEGAGGEGKGVRPTELLLMSLASCSSIDVVMILKKMRQPLEDIQVVASGERASGEVPAVFKKIHLVFHLTGDLKEEKVAQAIQLSVEKYCPVAAMLSKAAEISHSFTIRPAAGI